MTKEIHKDGNPPFEDLIKNSLDAKSKSISNEIEKYFISLDNKYLRNKEISIKAFMATKEFTRRIILLLKEHDKTIRLPKILIAGANSFDIYWKTEEFKVLINIHENRNEIIHIFGRDFTRPNNPIDTKVNHELSIIYLINWLELIL